MTKSQRPDILTAVLNGKSKGGAARNIDIANSAMLETEPVVKVEEKSILDDKWKVYTYREILEMDVPEVEWIIPNVLPVGLVSAIVAQSGAGKTWLAIDLMRALARGGKWAGKYEVKKRRTCLVDLEGSYVTTNYRIRLIEAGDPGGLTAEEERNLLINSNLGQIDVNPPRSVDGEPTAVDKLVALVEANKIEVLFVDSLSKTHYEDENSERMKAVMSALEEVARRTGCTVIIIHHMGRDATRGARGSTAIKAALQHIIELQGGEGNTEGLTKGVKVSLTKAKSSPLIPFMFTFGLDYVKEGDKVVSVTCTYSDEDVTKKQGEQITGKAAAKAYIVTRCDLNVNPGKTRKMLEAILDENKICKKSTTAVAIKELITEGSLVEVNGLIRARNVTTGETIQSTLGGVGE